MSSNMVRLTGINSGLDTEAIINAYTSTAQKRVQQAKNGKTLNTWTQEAWQNLNSKIYGFYANTLSATRLSTAYKKTKVTTSNSALSVVAGANAVNGIQSAKIHALAAAANFTGGKIDLKDTGANLSEQLGIDEGSVIKIKDGSGKERTIQIGGEHQEGSDAVVTSMNGLVEALKDFGINANFDKANGRLFLSAKESGAANDFSFEGDYDVLKSLGLATKEQVIEHTADWNSLTEEQQNAILDGAAVKVEGSDAVLELNGAKFTSSTNTFTINGSTYTINSKPTNPDEEISITTQPDYDGIYDVIKGMIKEYNDLINEMTKLYNAESSKGYDPLTDEQKEEMSEKEIEDWEKKIKDALLRGDSTVYDVLRTMVQAMNTGFDIGGKTYYLSDFGIGTAGYFEAEENERYALHIDGNTEDSLTGTKDDKLKSLIASDPEKVMSFFQQLSQKLYQDLYSKMGTTSLSSIYKVYNDKQLKSEATDWDKKIADLEDKLTAMEDKYYKKFSAMETALSKLNSRQSALSSLFGM